MICHDVIIFLLIQHVTDIIMRKRREMSDNECQITPLIDNLVLIDRNVDLLTPLLTQLTYEGLIDERMIIENSKRYNILFLKFDELFYLFICLELFLYKLYVLKSENILH